MLTESSIQPEPRKLARAAAAVKAGPELLQPSSTRVAALVAQDQNPRKLEPVHELKGFIALYQGNFREAAEQFAQGNLRDP